MNLDVGTVMARIRVDNSQFIRGINGSISTMTNLGNKFANVTKTAGLFAAGLGAAGAVAAASFVRDTLNVAASLEQQQIAFNTMLGSAEEGKKFTSELFEFAKKTPFEIDGVTDAAKRLMAFGFDVEEVIPTLQNMGDLSAIVGTEKLPFLITALGQVRGATRLTGNEARQFTENGIGIWEALEKQTGKSVQQIKKEMEAGMGPTFDEVQQALRAMSEEGGIAFNAMEQQVQSFDGIVSNLKDTWTLALNEIATESGMFDTAKDAAGRLLTMLDENKQMLIDMATEGVQKVITFFEDMKNVDGGETFTKLKEDLKELLRVVKEDFLPVIEDVGPETVVNTLRLIAKGLTLVAKGAAWAAPKIAYVIDALANFKENFSRIVVSIIKIIVIKKKRIELFIERIKTKIGEAVDAIKGFFEDIKNSDAVQFLQEKIEMVIEKFNTFKATVDLAWDSVELFVEIVKELASIAMEKLREKIEEIKTKISETLQPIVETISDKFNLFKESIMGVVNAVRDHFQPKVDEAKTKLEETRQKTEETKTKFQEFKDKVVEVVNKIKDKLNEFAEKLRGKFDEAKEQFQPLKDKLDELWTAFSDKFGKIRRKVMDVVTPLLRLRETLATILATIRGGSVDSAIRSVGGATAGGATKASRFAIGTSGFAGGRAIINERGPEEVMLPQGSKVKPTHITQDEARNDGAVLKIENYYAAEGQDPGMIARDFAQLYRLAT